MCGVAKGWAQQKYRAIEATTHIRSETGQTARSLARQPAFDLRQDGAEAPIYSHSQQKWVSEQDGHHAFRQSALARIRFRSGRSAVRQHRIFSVDRVEHLKPRSQLDMRVRPTLCTVLA
jgi:hypothetical protein